MTKKQIKNICEKVARKLIYMYPNRSSEHLIFPKYRNGNIRVSEQEARFVFADVARGDGSDYSIETPTEKRYSDFSSNPKVYGKEEMGGRSGSIDLSLYGKNEENKRNIPIVNIEFKKGQPTESSITKDILKLMCEPHEFGVFFHVLEHSDGGTLESLITKFKKSIVLIRKQKEKFHCSIFFLLIVILEENVGESRYPWYDIDISKQNPIK